MSNQNTRHKPPYLNPQIPKFGLLSIGSGLLAILVIVVAYKIFLSRWSGSGNTVLDLVLAIVFFFLPGTALGLALAGIFFGKEG